MSEGPGMDDNGYEGEEQRFLRTRCGVILRQRDRGDRHIVVGVLTQDDGNWFLSGWGRVSSYWIDEQIAVLREAQAWMHQHAEPDGRYGYRFKSAEE